LGCAPDPSGGGYSAHQTVFKGPTSKGREGEGKGPGPQIFWPRTTPVGLFYISPDPHLKAVNYKKMQKPVCGSIIQHVVDKMAASHL